MPGIVVHAKIITTSGSAVVGLRRVSDGKVVGQENTLLGQSLEVLVRSGGVKVLRLHVSSRSSCFLGQMITHGVLDPDVNEAIERETLDIGHRGVRQNGGLRSCNVRSSRVLLSRGLGGGQGQAADESEQALLGEHDGGSVSVDCLFYRFFLKFCAIVDCWGNCRVSYTSQSCSLVDRHPQLVGTRETRICISWLSVSPPRFGDTTTPMLPSRQ